METKYIENRIPSVSDARKYYAEYEEKTKWNNILKIVNSFQHEVENTGGVEGKGESYIVEFVWLSWSEFHASEKQLKELLRKKGWYLLPRNTEIPSIRVSPLDGTHGGY